MTDLVRVGSTLGLRLFADTQLKPGDQWFRAITAAIERSHTVLVFVGPNGVSEHQATELDIALNSLHRGRIRRIIPVLLSQVSDDDLPSQLKIFQSFGLRDLPSDGPRLLEVVTNLSNELDLNDASAHVTATSKEFAGKAKGAWDVFVAHHPDDRCTATGLACMLQKTSLKVWSIDRAVLGSSLDEQQLYAASTALAVVVVVGAKSSSPWQSEAVGKMILARLGDGAGFIAYPVLLPRAARDEMPGKLRSLPVLDLRDDVEKFVAMVKGKRRSLRIARYVPAMTGAMVLLLAFGASERAHDRRIEQAGAQVAAAKKAEKLAETSAQESAGKIDEIRKTLEGTDSQEVRERKTRQLVGLPPARPQEAPHEQNEPESDAGIGPLPHEDKPREDRPREDRPREDKLREDKLREDKPREDKPREDKLREDKPGEDKTREEELREDELSIRAICEPPGAQRYYVKLYVRTDSGIESKEVHALINKAAVFKYRKAPSDQFLYLENLWTPSLPCEVEIRYQDSTGHPRIVRGDFDRERILRLPL